MADDYDYDIDDEALFASIKSTKDQAQLIAERILGLARPAPPEAEPELDLQGEDDEGNSELESFGRDLPPDKFRSLGNILVGLGTGFDFGPFQDPNYMFPCWNFDFYAKYLQGAGHCLEHGLSGRETCLPLGGLNLGMHPPWWRQRSPTQNLVSSSQDLLKWESLVQVELQPTPPAVLAARGSNAEALINRWSHKLKHIRH